MTGTGSRTPLLVLDGELPPPEQLADLCTYHSPLIAADGAALQLQHAGICPDIIIGDLDVMQAHLNDPFFAEATIIRRPDQHDYDGAKALQWVCDEGHRGVTVIGSSGGMVDHILNNFSLFARFGHRLTIILQFTDCVGYIVTSDLELTTQPDERISLIPLPTARLTTRGLAWNLYKEQLEFGQREGTSNTATGTDTSVQVHDGILAVIHYRVGEQEEEHR